MLRHLPEPVMMVRAPIIAILVIAALGFSGSAHAVDDALAFRSDVELADAKLRLLQQQDARGLATFPISAKELRHRLRAPPRPAGPADASLHLAWHPYVAAWSHLSPSMSENALWFDQIPPMGELWAVVTDGDTFAGHIQVDLNPMRYAFVDDGVFTPWRLDSYANLEFPRESWLAATTEHLTLVAGRLKTGIGHGVFGNPFLNGKAPWYDQVQATFHTDSLRMFWMAGTSSSFLFADEAAVQSFGATAPPRSGWDPLNNYDSARFDAPAKTFMYRRLEYAPWPWLVLGVGEMGVVGGKWPDLTQLLPVVAWHNAYAPGSSNVMMAVDAAAVPLPGLLFFGELVIDDIATPYEVADSKPTSLGWQLGAQWLAPLDGLLEGSKLSSELDVELTHIDPWTYGRWQPYLVMTQRQVLPGGFRAVDIPLGYTWGGDVDQFGVSFTLAENQGLRVTASVEEMWRGPIRLGALTANILHDETGAEITDSFGQATHVPLYYDLDRYVGDGALGRVLRRPVELRSTVTLRAEMPLVEHATLLTTVIVSNAQNADNVGGAAQTRILLHAGLRLAL